MASNSYINDSRHGSRGTSPSPYKRSASIASTSYGGGGSGVGDGQTHTSRTRALARELAKETTPATLRDLEPLRHDIEKIKADLRNLERKNKFVSPDVVDTTWRELLNVKAFIGYSTGPGGRTPPGGRTWSSYHQHFLEDDEDSTNNGGGKKRLLIEGARHERIRREGEGDEDNTEKERAQSQRMKQKGDASETKGGTRDDKAFNIESSVAGSDSDGGGEGTVTPPRGLFGDGSRKQTKAAKPHTLASLAASGAPEEIVVNADGTNSSRASQSPSKPLGGHARNNTTSTTLTDVEALSPLTADDLFCGGSSSLTAVATTPAGQPKTPSSSATAAGGGSGAQAATPNSAHFTSLGFGASFGPEALRKVIAYEVAEAMKVYDLKCKQEREPQQGEKGKRSGISIGNSKSEAVKDRGDSEEDERDHHHNHDTFRRGGCYNTDFIGSHCCERNAEVHLEANRRLRIYLDESNRRAQLVQSFTSHWLISLSREHGRLIEVYDAHLSSLHRTSMNDVEVFLRHKDPQMRQEGVPLPSRGGADDTGNNITSIVISGGEEGLNSYHHHHGNGNNSEHVAIKTTINNKNKNTSHFFEHVVGGRAVASTATSLANPQHVMNHHHLQEQHLQQQERQGGGGGDFLYSPPFAPEQSYHNQLLRRDHLARAAEDESEAEDDENVNRVLKRKLGGAHGHGVGVGGRQHYHHLDPFASPPALNSHVTGTAYSNLVSDRFRAKAEALVTIIREDPYLVEKIGSAVLENKCVERAMRNDLVLAKRELPASVSSSALLRDPSNSAPSYQGAAGVATADLVSSAASGLLVVQRNDNNSNALGSGVQSQSTASSPSWLSIIDEVTAAQSEAAIERAVEHFNAIVEDKIVPRLNTLAHSKIKEVNENTKVALRAAEKFIEKRQVDSAAAVENTLNTVFEERSATLKKTEEEAKSVVNVVLVDRIRECEGLMKQLTTERENIKSCMDDARREDTRARDAASRRLWEALIDGMTVTTSRQIQHQEKENRSKGNGVAVGAAEAQAHSLLSRLLLPLPGSSSGIRASPSELVLPSSATQQHSTRHGGYTKKHNETSVLLTEQGLLETVARIGGAITKMSPSPCYSSSSLMDAIAFSVVSDEEAASFIKAVRAMRIDVEADYDDDDSDDVKQSESERKRSSQAPRPSVRVLAVLQPAASLLSELTRLVQNYNKRLGEEAEDEEGSINSLMTLEKLTALLNPSSSYSDYIIPQGAAKKKEDNVSSDDGERTGDDEEYSSDRGYTAGAPMKKRRKRNENWQNRSLTTLLESARKAIFSVTTHQRTTSSHSPSAQLPLPLPSWQTLASLALSIAASEYSKSRRIEADRLAILRSAAVKEQLKSNKSSSKRRNAEERGTSSSDASDDEMVISTRHTNRRNNHENNNSSNNNNNNNKYVKAHRERFGHPIITALRVHWHFILCTYAATTVQHSSFATLSQCARDVVVVYGIDDDKRTSTAERSESSDRPLRSHNVKSANSRRNQSDHQLSLPPQHPLNNGSTSSNTTSRNVSVTTRNTATSITTKAKTPSTTSLSQRVAVEDNDNDDDDDKEEDVISTTQLNSNSSTRIHYHQSTYSATALMLRNQHLSRVPAMGERRQRSLTEESEKRTKGGRGGLDGKRSPSFPLAAARANSLHPDERGSSRGASLHPHSSVLLDHHHPYGVGVSRESEQQRETERSSSSNKSGGRDFSKAKNATTASSPLVLPPYSSSSSYPSPSSPYSPNVDDPTKPLAIAISQLADALNAGNERARSQQQHQNYHDGDNQLPPSALSQALESNINSRKQEELQLRKMLAEAELRYRNVQKGQLHQYQQQQPPPQEQQYNNNIPEAQPSFSSSPAAHTADAFQRQNQQPPFRRQELATPATVGVGSEGGGGTRAAAALFRGASTGTAHHYGTMGLGASPDVRGAMLMGGGGGGPSYSPYPHQPITTTFTPRVVDGGYSTTDPHLQHRQQGGGGGSSAHVMAAMEVTAAAGDRNGERDVVGVLGLGKSAVQEADALVSKVEATAAARRLRRESSGSTNDRHAVVVVPSREVPSRQMSYMYEESEEKEARRTTDGTREGIHVNTQQPQPQLNTETRTNTTGATTATSAEGMTGISSSSSKKKKITVYHHHHSYISSAASSVASSISMEDNNNDNGFHVTDVTGGGVTKIRTLSGGMAPPPPSPPTELVTAAGVLSGVPNGVGVSTKRNSKLAIGATGSAAALAPVVATTGVVGGGSGVGSNNGGGGGFYTAASTATIAGRSTSIQQKKFSTRGAAASSQHTNSGGGQQLPAHHQQQQQHGQFYRSSSSSAAAAAPSQQQRRA